jgi:hypothetical protein
MTLQAMKKMKTKFSWRGMAATVLAVMALSSGAHAQLLYPLSVSTGDWTSIAEFKLSGYQFVVLDRKITRPDTSIPGGTPNTTVDMQIPQIIAPLTMQADAFNKQIIRSISMNAGNFGVPNFNYENPHNNYLVTAGLSAPIKDSGKTAPDMLPGVASFGIDISQYCNGCSVQRSWPTPVNWIIAKARPVVAEDIFDPKTNWQQALTDQACTRSTGCGLLYLTNLPVEAAFPPNWLLSRRGILIMFSAKYPASNMYEGTEGSVLVPWSSLKPYLKKDGLVPAGL